MTLRFERAQEELDQLVHVVAHDVRAPIRAIDALAKWIQLDLGDALTGDVESNMQLLRERVRRVDQLLGDLLEYSRASLDGISPEKVNVNDLVRELAEQSAASPTIRFHIEPQPIFETSITHLRRVLSNLVTNAVQHHDRESGSVSIRARDIGDYYEFAVTDDGPGIPKQFHARAFSMCQTLKVRDASTGSGMGLTIARRIVESAGGQLWLESDDASTGARGSTFIFTWPKQWPASREGAEGES